MRVLTPLLLLTLSAYAQAETLPSFLNSNDTVRTLPVPNLPADAYRPPTSKTQVPEAPPTAGQPLLMDTKVTIRKLQIEGGTVYPLAETAQVYAPLIGRETNLAQLIEATRGITRRYQEDGYLLSYAFLPQQNFENGLVRVVLVEGYIKDYQQTGDIGSVSAYVDKLAQKLLAERPLTRKTFERYTTLMSRIPGLSVQAQVPPPGTTDGATHMQIQASRKPFTTSMSLVQKSRGGTQALLSATSNSQTSMGEQLSVSGLFPPGEDKEHYYRVDYNQFINAEGTQLALAAERYRADPSSSVQLDGGFELKPHQSIDRYSIGLSHPFIASPTESFTLGTRLYAVDQTTRYKLVGYPLRFDIESNLRALAFEGDWRKADARRLRIISGGLYQGIDGLGAKARSDLDVAKPDLDFFRLRLSGVQSDKFFDNWQGVLSGALYWSNNTLPDSERATFGGQNFGRGYPDDQGSGDKGWGVAYEVNYSFNRAGNWVKILQPYVVVDRAKSWFNDLPVKANDMSSAAVGLRFGDNKYYNIALEAAKPMSDIALDSFNRRPRYTLSFSYQL
ncbi:MULTISPECIES: POTRA domain-containing protein [Pseudomonas]|jgi:hemolysin activation/secretion protein|uniref:ShlB/FhaC/HecB family hemolysin secretion/activation protein n=4 Tax=Pseudomonas TaxID=286 RepID=A0A4V1K1N9_PSEAZ|nr:MULTISPECIES: POTRA domain-containing protein [Pseudomonas]AVJ20808.1 ShlB/FhaC/HecB family hemolysin secretion/activation protein [Pseudomonas sp. MYb193]KRP88518.1 potassium ABC transporter ATPase [Pseudomonas lactis]KWV81770.1 Heme/hemopexin transporter protein HuxB precursor [Pseudomonas fluorescens]KWV82781.1 Heme/hemopexin transporter protein HuxB precursor [Pseudomonas fluorescens]MBA1255378.1 ShlB/FhaC/HecB family hemolysin secretion/activation protein [Pseudomonas carnis]